jgi:hypothetical protein
MYENEMHKNTRDEKTMNRNTMDENKDMNVNVMNEIQWMRTRMQ